MRQIAETGRMPASKSLGYRRKDKALVIDAETAPIIRDLFDRAADGASQIELVRILNEMRLPRLNGGARWYTSSIRSILRNPIYMGVVRWGDLLLPGTHEAIVSEERWREVQRIMDMRSWRKGVSSEHYSPLFRCGLCGESVCAKTASGFAQIMCYRVPLDRGHERLAVSENKAVAAVWRHTELLLAPANIGAAIDKLKDQARQARKHEPAIERELDDLARRRRLNLQALHDGALTASDLAAANAPLVQREEHLRSQLRHVDSGGVLETLEGFRKLGVKHLLTKMQALPVEKQIVWLQTIYQRVEIHPGNVLRFVHREGLGDPVKRQLPDYYAPKRGCGLGW
jgi:hypothetical protein